MTIYIIICHNATRFLDVLPELKKKGGSMCPFCESSEADHKPECLRDNLAATMEFRRGIADGYSYFSEKESGEFYLKGWRLGHSEAIKQQEEAGIRAELESRDTGKS